MVTCTRKSEPAEAAAAAAVAAAPEGEAAPKAAAAGKEEAANKKANNQATKPLPKKKNRGNDDSKGKAKVEGGGGSGGSGGGGGAGDGCGSDVNSSDAVAPMKRTRLNDNMRVVSDDCVCLSSSLSEFFRNVASRAGRRLWFDREEDRERHREAACATP
jgi:hypothetical protein